MAGKNKYLANMPTPAEDPIQRYPQMFGRFASLSKVLVTCLTNPTKESVHLPVNSLVALLTRVYNVNAKTLMSDARGVDPQEYYTLISGVSSLHLASNNVLMTLLATAQDHLVRHMSHLATIAVRLIRHTSGGSMGTIVRISTYSIVETCIQAFGIPFVNMIQAPLVNALLDDLRMPAAKVVNPLELGGSNANSRANNHTTKHKGGAGKNRRGQGAASASNPTGDEDRVSPQVFTAASSVLSLVLTTAGPSLAPHARAAADTLVVTHLLNSQHHVNPIEPTSETSFYIAAVRIQLYKTLVASISSPGEAQSNLVPLSVGIFKAGLNDTEKYVRDSCTMALTVCDLIMHSRMPPMQRARASYAAKKANKGEKAIQETGSALFGDFEVSESVVRNSKDEDESGSEEGEDEQEESDVDMEDRTGSDPFSTSGGEIKAAVDTSRQSKTLSAQLQEKTVSTVSAPKKERETAVSSSTTAMSIEVSQSMSASVTPVPAVSAAIEQTVEEESASFTSVTKATKISTTTATTTTQITQASSATVSASAFVGGGGLGHDDGDDNDDDDDIVIPAIVMEDDDDDEDMDSD